MSTMHDPAHPGESLRDVMFAEGWTVTETAAKLGCTRQTFSRLLNGRTGISPAMALALERIGWSNAAFWMRRQAQYDLAQERLRQEQPVSVSRSAPELSGPSPSGPDSIGPAEPAGP